MLLALMTCTVHFPAAGAVDQDIVSLEQDTAYSPKDTVYFYDSWQQMLINQPAAMYADPDVEVYSISEIYIRDDIKMLDDIIQNQHIALSIGDSIWLINSEYLKKNFEVQYNNIQRYNPVFFTDKAAFMCAYSLVTLKELINGSIEKDAGEATIAYYYIDFKNRKVERVNHKYLSKLLEDYHDLKMRYEGMKDYKKPHIIEEFLFQYIDRASEDILRPSIPDLIAASQGN